MEKYSVTEITTKSVWDKFVLSQNPQSFLQSWNWGETYKQYGETIWRLGFYKGGKLVGVALLIGQNAKRGKHILIPGGPLIEWGNNSLVSFVFKSIQSVAKNYGAWFVRMRPELVDTPENIKQVRQLGFVKAPMHLNAENTWVLSVEKSEEELLSGMRKNTRYMVRKSLQSDLSIESDKTSKGIATLYKLQNETVSRNKFVGFSEKFFKCQMDTFGEDGQAELYVIRKNNKPLAAAIILFYGDYAYYHHSGSSNKMREIPSSYYLQWYVIREARKRKLKGYNFWGIAPEGNTNHRFSGVTTFKTGFGGTRIDWVSAQDLPISSLYWATYLYESIRKRMRNL